MIREDFGEIICSLRNNAHLSQHELAEKLCHEGIDVTNQHIYKWEKNINRPNAIQFIGLCSVLHITDVCSTFTTSSNTPYSRLNYEGQLKVDEFISILDASSLYRITPTVSINSRTLPVYVQPAAAGTGQFLDDYDYDIIEVGADVDSSADFGIHVSGDSMEPVFANGQIVWVHKQNCLENGDIGIFFLNGNAYIKKFYDNGKEINLISINRSYSPIPVRDTDEFITYGKVLWHE